MQCEIGMGEELGHDCVEREDMYMKARLLMVLSMVLAFTVLGAAADDWAPVGDKIMTRWADQVGPERAWPEYPRPQMKRQRWQNLNGLWDYSILAREASQPQTYDGQILVPFAVESALSGVGKTVGPDQCLWYHRSFVLAPAWDKQRILLHFGAVDWDTSVWVNGHLVGSHQGGYDPFSFDITATLKEDGPQDIIMRVWDPTDHDNAPQARGKQVLRPGGIFYTAVTGIWQTVWLEPVAQSHIRSLKITPNIDQKTVTVEASIAAQIEGLRLSVLAKQGWFRTFRTEVAAGQAAVLRIPKPKLWSPSRPFLYDLQVVLKDAQGKTCDRVASYFGMRKISLQEDAKGVNRLFLNNEPLFQFGPLDQGWWPDGLYTAPTDEALRYDLEVTQQLGFNMLRKHVKLEPQRLYYCCDKMGLLVWQDMPSSLYKRDSKDAADLKRIDAQWELELKRMIDAYRNHPCIVMWVPFNEGWGQYDTERITQWVKQYDPTRLVNNASGWTDKGVGDVHDVHAYPGPHMPPLERHRAAVLGEFGGLGLPVEGHVWQDQGNWGYRSYEDAEAYAGNYIKLVTQLYGLVDKGLAGAVYTQTTDCEVETNGLMTYDRDVIKLDPKIYANLNRGLIPPQFPDTRESFLRKKAVELLLRNPNADICYTLDGTEPVRSSKRYTAPIRIDDTVLIRARSIWPNGDMSVVVSKQYTKLSAFTPAVDVTLSQQGLKCEYYAGHWSKLPEFDQLKPVRASIVPNMNLDWVAKVKQDFALRFTGYIRVTHTDVYSFFTHSDDGSRLTIAGQTIVNNDGVHGMAEQSGEIALGAGWHPIELVYFQGVEGLGLRVGFSGPGFDKKLIPGEILGYE